MSGRLADVVALLTAPSGGVRGGEVDPSPEALDALQRVVHWTVGSDGCRPAPQDALRKHLDRMAVLLKYRQGAYYVPRDEGSPPPPIDMYDSVCHTMFHLPLRHADPPAGGFPSFVDADGDGTERVVVPEVWYEVDWAAARQGRRLQQRVVFHPNAYPYQLPAVRCEGDGCVPCDGGTRARHYVLWFLHLPEEGPAVHAALDSAALDVLVRERIAAALPPAAAFDYIWYRNPKMTVPDLFHVQVFWMPREA
eukprot:TRINITY_DN22011_c0_g1_i1.p2 TRINITY_DN22011_c0_g1~~TRINITY_DN22011_c0_g1_i1.p2  ORF type:complete len:251 (+),score=73.65 TRINITY_DN22011_c0_g1_i1:46-798(+)